MSPLKLLSVNVGVPREVDWQGRLVRTSIFKSPVLGPVRVTTLNLEGDGQSDLTVHGGVHKAVYAYPSESIFERVAVLRSLRPTLANAFNNSMTSRPPHRWTGISKDPRRHRDSFFEGVRLGSAQF
jgi:hypothetical protein